MHVYASNEYMYKEQGNPETINFPRHDGTATTNKFFTLPFLFLILFFLSFVKLYR